MKFAGLFGSPKVEKKVLIGNTHVTISIVSVFVLIFLMVSRQYLVVGEWFRFLNFPEFFYSEMDTVLFIVFFIIFYVVFLFMIKRIEVSSGGVTIYKRSDVERMINKGEIKDVEFISKESKFITRRGNKYTQKFKLNLVNGESVLMKSRLHDYVQIKKDFESNNYPIK